MNGSWKLRGRDTSRGAGPEDTKEEERTERYPVLDENALPMIDHRILLNCQGNRAGAYFLNVTRKKKEREVKKKRVGEKDCFPVKEKMQWRHDLVSRTLAKTMPPLSLAALIEQTVSEINHLGPNFQVQHYAEHQMHSNGYFHGE